VVALMREYKTPMTREEFLNLNYMGNVPDEISPEDEAEFPPEFQLNPDPKDDNPEDDDGTGYMIDNVTASMEASQNCKTGARSRKYPFLYHGTRRKNLDDILKNGLKTEHSDSHNEWPYAIYLSDDPTVAKSYHAHQGVKLGDWVVLQVDTKKLNEQELVPDDFDFPDVWSQLPDEEKGQYYNWAYCPWYVSLAYCSQVAYLANIPPSAFTVYDPTPDGTKTAARTASVAPAFNRYIPSWPRPAPAFNRYIPSDADERYIYKSGVGMKTAPFDVHDSFKNTHADMIHDLMPSAKYDEVERGIASIWHKKQKAVSLVKRAEGGYEKPAAAVIAAYKRRFKGYDVYIDYGRDMRLASQEKYASPDFGYTDYNEEQERDLNQIDYELDEDSGSFQIEAKYDYGDGEVKTVGRIVCVVNGKAVAVSTNSIANKWRGTGLGQLLYDQAIAVAKSKGFTQFQSDDNLTNDAHAAWVRLQKRYPVTQDRSTSRYSIDLTEATPKAKAMHASVQSKTAAVPTHTMYHVSRRRNRASIQKLGLEPRIQEFDDIERKPGIYMLETLAQAQDWAYWFGSGELQIVDIWEITLPNGYQVEPETSRDFTDIYDAWVGYQDIPPANLKLVESMQPDKKGTNPPPPGRTLKVKRSGH
jgi:RNA:NAD 2'-phosphotransferase (TPT1/KptA family)